MTELTYAQAINAGIREEMQIDNNVVVLGEDIGKYGGVFGVTKGLYDEFGAERVRDCPLNEAAIVGFGVGLAISGKPAITEIEFMDFLTFCMDPIVNQAAKMRFFWGGQVEVPLVVRMPIASTLGFGTQHSQSLEAWLMHIPGLKLVMPSDPYDAKGLVKTSIRDRNPVIFVENISLYATKGEVPDEEYLIPLGKANIKRTGSDLTIVAISSMVPKAIQAAELLAKDGIDVTVIDPRSLCPLDIETIIESVKQTGRLIVSHVAHKTGGVGAEIAQQVTEQAFDYLDAPVMRVAAQDVPIAASQVLEAAIFPDVKDLIDSSKSFSI